MKLKKYRDVRLLSQFTSFKDFVSYVKKRDVSLLKREWFFFWQRLTRGWDDSETWNLQLEMNEFMYPRVKRLFEVTIFAPPYDSDLDRRLTEEEFETIKEKILYSLKTNRLNNKKAFDLYPEEYKKIKEGEDLLHKYRHWLWW